MERLAPVLAKPPPTWSAAPLPPEKRRDVLTSDGLHDDNPLRQLTSGEALVSPRDDANYGRALAQELAPLACGLEDENAGGRFLLRVNELGGDALAVFARKLTIDCPALVAKLDANDRRRLTDAAAKP